MSSKRKEKGMTVHFLQSPIPGCRAGCSQITHSHPRGTDVCDGKYNAISPSLTITCFIELNFCQGSSPGIIEGASGHYPNRKHGPTKPSILMELQSLCRSPTSSSPSEQQKLPIGSSPQSPGAELLSLVYVCLWEYGMWRKSQLLFLAGDAIWIKTF